MTDLAFFIEIITKASIVVQVVMGILLFISIYSWTLIFYKSFTLARARYAATVFENQFWKGKDLNALYSQTVSSGRKLKGMENIFTIGYIEFSKQRKLIGLTPLGMVEGCHKAMRAALHREIDKLDESLTALATIGSVSPYIGLFGTVWGIMNSFHALGGMQQVTLALVAPGISEALIATAMGLFAAIPAVIAYNNYSDKVERLVTRYETFMDEFMGVLNRQAHTQQLQPVIQQSAPAPLSPQL